MSCYENLRRPRMATLPIEQPPKRNSQFNRWYGSMVKLKYNVYQEAKRINHRTSHKAAQRSLQRESEQSQESWTEYKRKLALRRANKDQREQHILEQVNGFSNPSTNKYLDYEL